MEYLPDPELTFCSECGKPLGATLAPAPAAVAPPVVESAAMPVETQPMASVGVPAGNMGRGTNIQDGCSGNVQGQNVSIRHEVTVEFCSIGGAKIIGGRVFMCPECHRQPVCDKHFDENKRMCFICVEKQSIECWLCGETVQMDQTFECTRCRRVAGLDHRGPSKNWCSDCTAKHEEFTRSLGNDEVVITAGGEAAIKSDVELVGGELRTKSGERVATIKENIWYVKPKQWFRVKPKLLRREYQAMRRFYPNMRNLETPRGELAWQGSVTTWPGNEYQVELRYPANYPYAPPKAYIVEPTIEQSRHIYPDGHLCLFHKDDKTWQPETTAATVMSWVALWLHCYEVWAETGEWPRREHDQLVVTTNY